MVLGLWVKVLDLMLGGGGCKDCKFSEYNAVLLTATPNGMHVVVGSWKILVFTIQIQKLR